MNEDVYYLVSLDANKIFENEYNKTWLKTTIRREFCGKIVKAGVDTTIFELNSIRKPFVIIPNDWIIWMAPSKELWEK